VEGEFEGPSDVEDLPLCDPKSYKKQQRQSAIWRPRTIIITNDRTVNDNRNHHNYRHYENNNGQQQMQVEKEPSLGPGLSFSSRLDSQ
jgi:hypothetical protein